MLLMRHNSLLPPYHDYEALTQEQLDALATDRISPDIADLPATLPLESGALLEAAYFVCSQSSRTQQTCMALRQRLGLVQPVSEDSGLNEIFFVPSRLPRAIGESPLAAVRKTLYPAIATGSPAVEAAERLKTRMDTLLIQYARVNAVLFSHGFFIRLLQSYVASKGDMENALKNIEKYPTVSYLELRRI